MLIKLRVNHAQVVAINLIPLYALNDIKDD